jgi:hypothetical protein
MRKPEIKQNINPKQRYDVTMSIQDAPGRLILLLGMSSTKCSTMYALHFNPEAEHALRRTLDYPLC